MVAECFIEVNVVFDHLSLSSAQGVILIDFSIKWRLSYLFVSRFFRPSAAGSHSGNMAAAL